MNKLIVLMTVGILSAATLGVANAQELLIPPGEVQPEGLTPDLALPPLSGVPDSSADSGGDASSGTSDSTSSSDIDSYAYGSDFTEVYQCDPSVLESTGTWLRRGFWYAEVDAVISNRKWSRDTMVFASQVVGQTVVQLPNGANILANTENQLRVNGRRPGAEGAPRLTLGHFMFRDAKNRDHVVEFTAYGGGQWTEEASLTASTSNLVGSDSLLVPILIDNGELSFDFADQANFRYDSRFNSFELNYLVKDRMGKDRMEMEPSGQWVRRAGPTVSRSILAGIRYFDLTEDFLFAASGIDDDPNAAGSPDDIGLSSVRTDNDMIGTQVGLNVTYETARWSFGIESKGGLFLNVIDMNSVFSLTQNATAADDDILVDTALEDDQLSFIGEAALQGKWHLRPNFSLRAGFDFMFVTSQAIAPSQYPNVFTTGGPSRINTSGESTWIGGSIGFEGYW